MILNALSAKSTICVCALACLFAAAKFVGAKDSPRATASSGVSKLSKPGEKVKLKDVWYHSIATDAVSASGMPTGELFTLLRKGKRKQFRTLLAATPVKPGDHNERIMWEAACLSSEDRYEQAIVLFDKVKDLNSANMLVRVKAAKAYAEEDQTDKAIALVNSVLSKYQMVEAYEIRASCYGSRGKLAESAADFEKLAILQNGSRVSYYCKSASLFIKAHKLDDAMRLINSAIDADGKLTPEICMVRADCYKSLGRWQDAANDLTTAIKLINEKIDADKKGDTTSSRENTYLLSTCYKERSNCYQKLGRTELVKADLRMLESYSKSISDELIGK